MHDLFISYRSTDLALAEDLNRRLTTEGFRVWFDKLRLDPGCNWHREIEAACEASRVILPVLTPRWQESQWCLFETYGGECIIPLLYEGEWSNDAPPPLRSYQFLDFRPGAEANWSRLQSAIEDYLRRPPAAKAARLASLPITHNPHFVGRDQLLLDLHGGLHSAITTALTQAPAYGIVGLGGVGKTTLAREYAEKFWRLYQDILWVRADDGDLIKGEFARLALDLRLTSTPSKDTAADAALALRELAGQKPRLLILDNADSEESIQAWIPKSGGCRTIITSRFAGWSAAVARLPVDVLAPEASRQLLLARSDLPENDGNAHAADQLAKALDYLPLALEQAAAFAQNVHIDFDEYLRLFAESRRELLAERALGGTQYPDSVVTTWWTTVERLSPLARAILRLAAFLDPDNCPVQMLEETREQLREGAVELAGEGRTNHMAGKSGKSRKLWRVGRDPHGELTSLALRKALGELAAYSMISLRGDGFSTHRLVQAVEIDHLNQRTRRRWARRGVQVVNLAFPEPDNPRALHGGYFSGESSARAYRLLPSAKCCVNISQQLGIGNRDLDCLRNKVRLGEAALFYQEEWDRAGGMWE